LSKIRDTTTILEPFMCAQRLLEGECYATVLMLVLSGKEMITVSIRIPMSSLHVAQLDCKMNNLFEQQWDCGDPGTVATKY
jgi:hypothetical protein